MKALAVCIALACGCGGDDAAGGDAGTETPDADTCDRTCVETRWWVTTTSGCQAACAIDPALDECGETDCEMIEARYYDGTAVASLVAVLHSATARSIYVAATPTSDPYTVDGCSVTAGMTAPQSFSCVGGVGGELTFQTAVFGLPSSGLEGALIAADSAGTTGRYPYSE